MSEHCKCCNFPCDDGEIFCSECVNEIPRVHQINEVFKQQKARIKELEDELQVSNRCADDARAKRIKEGM